MTAPKTVADVLADAPATVHVQEGQQYGGETFSAVPCTAHVCLCGEAYSYPVRQPRPCPKCGVLPGELEGGIPFIKGRGNTAHDHDWREVKTLGTHIKQLCARCGLETFGDARRLTMTVPCDPRELTEDQALALAGPPEHVIMVKSPEPIRWRIVVGAVIVTAAALWEVLRIGGWLP